MNPCNCIKAHWIWSPELKESLEKTKKCDNRIYGRGFVSPFQRDVNLLSDIFFLNTIILFQTGNQKSDRIANSLADKSPAPVPRRW